MTAIDLSPEALALAAENAALNGLADRVELLEGDLLAPVAGRHFDLVASNPPYVAEGETVDPEVAGFEPALAVYAERRGRAIHERLAEDALSGAAPGRAPRRRGRRGPGAVARRAPRRARLYEAIAVTRDLRGIERVVEAQAPS